MTIIKTISISREFDDLATANKLSWTEAARIGMSILLADIGLAEYDNNLNLFRKMRQYQLLAQESLQKLNDLEEKYEKSNTPI